MHHIVYISAASKSFENTDIQDILNTARALNARDSITGMLMFYQHQFLQVLEGEKDVVHACFNRIRKDLRHSGVIVLYEESGQNRMFDQWNMGLVDFDSCEKKLQNQLFDLFEINSHPDFQDLRNNKIISIFVKTYLADLRSLKSGFQAA